MKNLLTFKYNIKNINMLLETAITSAFAANFIAPLIAIYTTYDYIQHTTLMVWFILHSIILVSRLIVIKKLTQYIKNNTKKIVDFSNILLFLTSMSAILYGYLIWTSVLTGMPDLNIFMLTSVILALSAGSISTLMSVFHIFAIFVGITMFSTITALLYHGEDIFYIFTILLIIFSVTFIKAGYKQYLIINNLISLKNSFQTIYEKSTDAIILIKDNKFKDCNLALIKMFGFTSKEELLTFHILELMPKYQEDGKNSLRKMMEMAHITLKNDQHSFEWIYRKKDGSTFWCDIVLTKIYIDGEELIHGVYRDITNRKELEKQKDEFQKNLTLQVKEEVKKNREKDKAMLQQSRLAQMGEMISMIAHQWRQPLSAISATSGSITLKARLGKLDKQSAIELAANITEYSQHLSTTIDDFRNFFKEDKHKDNVSLKSIVESTLSIVETSLQKANIEIVTNLTSDAKIFTYKNELKQVVLNIIKNAEDALIEKNIKNPTIKIDSDDTTITISDNAGGIPQEIIDKIFEPYFSTKTKKDGTGLGLYMSKTIIEEHCDGKLNVYNDNKGAVFTLHILSNININSDTDKDLFDIIINKQSMV